MPERTAPPAAEWHTNVPYVSGLADVPAARSSICFIDGEIGILEYRGYPIEALAERSTFEETSYLLLWGKLPNKTELEKFTRDLSTNRDVRFRLIDLLKCLPDTGHPMEALQAAIAALGMFYPDRDPMNPTDRYNSAVRIIAKAPTLVAAYHRLSHGKEYIPPREDLTHAENFLYMVSGEVPEPDVARVMDICFILHAEHSMNASTLEGRVTACTLADPYMVGCSAIEALTGRCTAARTSRVIHMLQQIREVRRRSGPTSRDLIQRKQKITGVGHRIYKVKDPRALVLQKLAAQMIAKRGTNPLLAGGPGSRGCVAGASIPEEDLQRRLLFRRGLRGDGHAGLALHAGFRHRPRERLAGALARAARGQPDLSPVADLHGHPQRALRSDRRTRLAKSSHVHGDPGPGHPRPGVAAPGREPR
jgi:citrate synthase